MNINTSTAAGLILCASTLAMTGCLIMSGKSIDESGTRVTHNTLNQVETGVTTEAWVRATLGAPSEETVVEDYNHVRILRYDHVVEKSEGGAVFLLFAGGSDKRTVTRSYFEITNGVVTKFWKEGESE
jgi:outer membrane protein assembly factor BamE (lipoprotein component of BamABCDE complex)